MSPSSANRFRASALSNSPLKSNRMSLGASLPADSAVMDEDRPPTKTYADLEASRALGGPAVASTGSQDSFGTGHAGSLHQSTWVLLDFRANPLDMRTDNTTSYSRMNNLPIITSSTKLRIFGVSSHLQQGLKKLFEQIGPITYFEPGPIESNFVILAFANPAHAMRALRQSGDLRYNGCYLGVKEIGGDEIDMGNANGEANREPEDDNMQVDSMSTEEPQMVQINGQTGQQPTARLPQSQSRFTLSSGIETLQPRRTDSPFRVQAANNATRKQGQKMQQTPPEFSFGTVQMSQSQNGQQQQQSQQQSQSGQGGLRQSTSMRFVGMFADALVCAIVRSNGRCDADAVLSPTSLASKCGPNTAVSHMNLVMSEVRCTPGQMSCIPGQMMPIIEVTLVPLLHEGLMD